MIIHKYRGARIEQQRDMLRFFPSGTPVSGPDYARFAIIALFSLMIAASAAIEVPRNPATAVPQLFYIPILYAAFFYPRAGMYVAGICAVVYEIVAMGPVYPDLAGAAGVIGQGVTFIIVATVVAYLSETNRSIDGANCRLTEQIQRDNERRRGVIITVAHELRTPLQPLMGYLNLILADPREFGITKETETMLNRCMTSVERERAIINRMLEFSVLESGKITPAYSVFSVRECIETVISTGGYSASAAIAIDIPDGLTFDADAARIGGAIDSLLSNAVAYSRPPRQIRISHASPVTSACHELSIRDNGIGIPADLLETIFEPFQLADSATLSRKYDRIGLSLSIAQKYLQMHGGYISVQSVVNEGSTFTIHLPKDRSSGECP